MSFSSEHGTNRTGLRGFAAMSPEERLTAQRAGVAASHAKGHGFQSMTPERRSQIGRMGGLAAQRNGTARRFTSETGREAGRKGGRVKRTPRLGE